MKTIELLPRHPHYCSVLGQQYNNTVEVVLLSPPDLKNSARAGRGNLDHRSSHQGKSQYRHNIEEYLDDPVTIFAYTVFDSFQEDRNIEGVIVMNIYWKLLFANILLPSASGIIICILENSFN
jgi:hypothetical protein